MSAIMLLRGITHVLITTAPTKEQSISTGIIATVDLCFGPGDANCISGIDYVLNSDKKTTWRMPSISYTQNGVQINTPVFKGGIAEEVSRWAAHSLDRVRKEIGAPKWGKVYRIPTGSSSKVEVEVLVPSESGPGKGKGVA